MKIITISDIHSNIQILDFITEKIEAADLILLSGDITHFGKEQQAAQVIDKIRESNPNILAVPGNCDYPEVNTYLEKEGLSVNLKMVEKDGILFTGIGGSLPCPTPTPYEFNEEEIEEKIFTLLASVDGNKPMVFLLHNPPYNTLNDKLSTGEHVGSHALRKAIEEFQPLICFSGHIHEGAGIDNIGNTQTINPGAFNTGKFAFAEIKNNTVTELDIRYIV